MSSGNRHLPATRVSLGPKSRIGLYEIERPCGEGGFAVVYRAMHTKLMRPAAIKVMHAKLAHRADLVKRFENEAQMITRIQHPNIVDIYDFGALDDGRPYFVMEWLEGRPLADELRDRGQFDRYEILQLAEEIGAGLDVIHQAGVVHRDLKSNNIMMLSGVGMLRIKLLDFGIAKLLDTDTGLSLPGMLLGTPETMAPEQIQSGIVGPESDVYAFGILLYELATGRLPFRAPIEEEVHSMQLTAPRPTVSEHADVGPAFDAIVKKCMAIERAERYQSVPEVLDALRKAIKSTPSLRPRVQIGDVLSGSYRLASVVGRGGMGTVFEAEHTRLPQRVAVKVINGAVEQNAFARFRREAEIASSLGHASIVKVVDFNTLADGTPYLVMEFLDGEDLAAVLAKGPLEFQRVMSIARQAASALRAVHERKLVHRDLKPSNLFLGLREVAGTIVEHVTILDFGVSKLQNSSAAATDAQALVGTPRYMAPEQALGNTSIDGRADQFALALLVYEMLSATPAFDGERLAEVVYKVVHQEPRPIQELVPSLPQHTVNALSRALRKDPNERFSSIVEFVEELSGQTLELLPQSPGAPEGSEWGADTNAEVTLLHKKRADAVISAQSANEPSKLVYLGLAFAVLLVVGVAVFILLAGDS